MAGQNLTAEQIAAAAGQQGQGSQQQNQQQGQQFILSPFSSLLIGICLVTKTNIFLRT